MNKPTSLTTALLLVTAITNLADAAFANMPPPEVSAYMRRSTRYLSPAHQNYRRKVVLEHAKWDDVIRPFEQPGVPLALANCEHWDVQQWAQLKQQNLEKRKKAVASFFDFYLAASNNSIRRSWLVDAANDGQTSQAGLRLDLPVHPGENADWQHEAVSLKWAAQV